MRCPLLQLIIEVLLLFFSGIWQKRLILKGLFQRDISFKIDIKEVPSFYEPSFGHQMKKQNVPKLSLTPRKAILSRPLPRSYLHFIAKVLTNFVRWIFNEKSYPSRCLGWQQYWICGCGGTPVVCWYTQGKGRFSLMINDPTRFPYLLFKKHLKKALYQKKMIL